MQKSMDSSSLEALGLTPREARLYVTLLQAGQCLASTLAKKADVERAVTYHTLEKLHAKGLVSFVIKENRKYFAAASPEKLRDLIREEEDLVESLIPELRKLNRQTEQPLVVEVFSGIGGFKTIMNDLLIEKNPYYIIGYTGKGTQIAPFWYHHWNKRRVKQGIKRFLLIHKGNEQLEALHYPLTSLKLLTKTADKNPLSSTIIYDTDKVTIFLPLQEFAAIRIKSKEIHTSYKTYFDALWKTAKRNL